MGDEEVSEGGTPLEEEVEEGAGSFLVFQGFGGEVTLQKGQVVRVGEGVEDFRALGIDEGS